MCSKMEESPEKKDRVSSSRRNNKPLMEKRRRARINDCLVQLKSLVLQAMNKDTTQYSKLEKADILEMTVKHLKLVQRQQVTAAMATDPNVISKYRAGFNECASEIARYLDTVNGGNPELKNRVMNYLANSMMQFPVIPVYQGVVSSFPVQMAAHSQHGYNVSPFSHGNAFTNGGHSQQQQAHHLPIHHQQPHQKQPHRDTRFYSPHSLDSMVKREHSPINVNVDITSRMTSQTISPIRRLPSPYDSDSGLSDSSTSFSHDENGNYSQFNINQDLRHDHESRLHLPVEGGRDVIGELDRHKYGTNKQSSKRKCDANENIPFKRYRSDENVRHEENRDVRENDSMWRPW